MPQSNQRFDQLILAVAFNSGDADDLARPDLELDAVDGSGPTIVVDDQTLQLHHRFARLRRFPVDLQHDRPADHQPSQVRGA